MISSRNWIDVIGQNLSNVDTIGFKRTRAEFQDLLYRQVANSQNGPGPLLQVGSGSDVVAVQNMFFQGALADSDSATDLAVFGDGFFPIDLPDGTVAYTRNGNFHPDVDGRLVNPNGQRLASALSVPAGFETFAVQGNGEVVIKMPDSNDSISVGQIPLARFANPAGLISSGDNLWRATDASGAAQIGNPGDPGFGQVQAGRLERPTVQLSDEMTQLLIAQRSYQLNSRALSTLDAMIGRITEQRP
jgi:flagellar basal-body rod protein FlgG